MRVTIFSLAIFFCGCLPVVTERAMPPAYALNSVKTTPVGSPFLIDISGVIRTVKTWVGLLKSDDGWAENNYYMNQFRKELIYSGKQGSTIAVVYREFREGLIAPAFTQELKYDLKQSKVIRFQRFSLEVLSADNSTITTKVISDQ